MAEIDTAAAMRIAGVNQFAWRKAMGSRYFLTAPPTVTPIRRLWDEDHLVCLLWWGGLVTMGLPVRVAGILAARLLRVMRSHPQVEMLHLYGRRAERGDESLGEIAPVLPDEPDVLEAGRLPVALWRCKIRAATLAYQRREAERMGKRRG